MKNFSFKASFVLIPLFLFFLQNTDAQNQQFVSVGIGGGGGLFSPSINPLDGDEYYVSCDLGAMFHSVNDGGKYDIVPFTQVQSGVFGKVSFTNNNNIRYTLRWDKENYARRPAISMDAGINWQYMAGESDPWEDKYFIYADFNNSGRIIWSTYDQIFISNDQGQTSSAVYSANSDAGILLSGVYFDGNNIYLGTNDGVLVSTDGGNTVTDAGFSGIPSNERIMGFGAGSNDGLTRFFALTGGEGDVWCDNLGADHWGAIRGIYTMDNISGTWAKNMNGVDVDKDYAVYLAMANNDPNTCYIAGAAIEPYEKPLIMKTADGGDSWQDVFLTNNNDNIFTGYQGFNGDFDYWWGGFAMGFTVNPSNSQQVLMTDLGYIHGTDDGGATWHQKYLDVADENAAGSPTPKNKAYHGVGLEQTSVWQIYFFDENNIFGCFTDIKGVRSVDKGESWSMDYTGQPLNTTYHITKHNTANIWFAATSAVHDMYETTHIEDESVSPSWKDGKVLFSTDMGANWQIMGDFETPVIWVATDPTNDDVLYASVISPDSEGGLWKATNASNPANANWEHLPSPDGVNIGRPHNIRVLDDGTILMSWGVRSGDVNSTFYPGSGVYVSTDGGASWEDKSNESMKYWTQDVVVDPFDAEQNTWYACVWSGWGGSANDLGRLWRTTDRGDNWEPMTAAAQFHRVYSVTVDPKNEETMYLTTETSG